MISPLAIATHGLLNSPLSVAAIRGHLTIESIPPVPPGNLPGGSSDKPLSHRVILARIQREDDEILAIIMASVDLLE